jgi:hypothetical protein
MLDKTHILNHAKSAVDQTASSLTQMHARLQTAELSRLHRLIVEETLRDLSRRHEILVDLYEGMLDAPADELPTHWQRFFVCYDDYLEAVRDAKCRLVREIK